MSDLEKTFEEQPGSPASQQLKKLAREKTNAKKAKKYEKTFYTSLGGKILQVTAKPHGAVTSFIGRKDKDKQSKEVFAESVKKWKLEKSWVSEEDYEEVITEACKELASKKDNASKQ